MVTEWRLRSFYAVILIRIFEVLDYISRLEELAHSYRQISVRSRQPAERTIDSAVDGAQDATSDDQACAVRNAGYGT